MDICIIFILENGHIGIETMHAYIKKDEFEALIARKNIKLDDLAQVLGVKRSYISMLKYPEKYDCSPSPGLRVKIMNFLECKFDDIFFLHNVRFKGHKL